MNMYSIAVTLIKPYTEFTSYRIIECKQAICVSWPNIWTKNSMAHPHFLWPILAVTLWPVPYSNYIALKWPENCSRYKVMLPRLWRHAYPTMVCISKMAECMLSILFEMKCNIFYTKNDKKICDKILKFVESIFQTEETYCHFPSSLFISVQLWSKFELAWS
jgi:hypothetical protein